MIPTAHAQSGAAAAQCLVDKINDVFLFPLIALLSAIAFLVFLYGAFQYVRNSDSQEGRQTGQRHLLYGVIGLLVMFSAYTILQIAAGTFGVSTTVGPSQLAPCSSVQPQGPPDGPGGIFDIGGFGDSDTGVDRGPGYGSGTDDTSGQNDVTTPDLGTPSDSDNDVVPGGPINPDPNPDDTVIDTTSADPRYPILDTWTNGTLQLDCGGEQNCLGAIQSCESNHNGTYDGSIVPGEYILCL